MRHPDRKISFILCNTFVILVWINARLWGNADTSCQRKTVYNCPSLLSWGIFIIIFSASQRDEQNSCSEYKAEIEWATAPLTFTVEVHSMCVEILMTSVVLIFWDRKYCFSYILLYVTILGLENMKFIHLFICSHSTFTNATCGWTHKAAGWALADEAVSLTSEVGLLLRKEDVFGGGGRNDEVLLLNSRL